MANNEEKGFASPTLTGIVGQIENFWELLIKATFEKIHFAYFNKKLERRINYRWMIKMMQ